VTYGPLAASPEGMTFLTLRRSHDPGAQRLPESKPKLEAVPDRRPWQITCDAAFGSEGAFVYDEAAGLPEDGIAPGTRWEDVPESWTCPDCAATKRDFQMIEL
jgi:rubredoxin